MSTPTLTPGLSLQTFGLCAVFGSAFFYLAIVIIRWSAAYVTIPSAYYVFTRLFLGFLLVAATMALQRQRPRPVKYHLLVGRAVANILNMTYPLFVTVFSWFFLRGLSSGNGDTQNRESLLSVPIIPVTTPWTGWPEKLY